MQSQRRMNLKRRSKQKGKVPKKKLGQKTVKQKQLKQKQQKQLEPPQQQQQQEKQQKQLEAPHQQQQEQQPKLQEAQLDLITVVPHKDKPPQDEKKHDRPKEKKHEELEEKKPLAETPRLSDLPDSTKLLTTLTEPPDPVYRVIGRILSVPRNVFESGEELRMDMVESHGTCFMVGRSLACTALHCLPVTDGKSKRNRRKGKASAPKAAANDYSWEIGESSSAASGSKAGSSRGQVPQEASIYIAFFPFWTEEEAKGFKLRLVARNRPLDVAFIQLEGCNCQQWLTIERPMDEDYLRRWYGESLVAIGYPYMIDLEHLFSSVKGAYLGYGQIYPMQSKFNLFSTVPPPTSYLGDYWASGNCSGAPILIDGTRTVVGVHVSNVFGSINANWSFETPQFKNVEKLTLEEKNSLLTYLAKVLALLADRIGSSRELSKFSPLLLAWTTRESREQ